MRRDIARYDCDACGKIHEGSPDDFPLTWREVELTVSRAKDKAGKDLAGFSLEAEVCSLACAAQMLREAVDAVDKMVDNVIAGVGP